MMRPDLEYQLIQEPAPEQQQTYEQELLDAHPEVVNPLLEHLENRIIEDPWTVKIVVFDGEAGSMKGTFLSQFGQHLASLRLQHTEDTGDHTRIPLRIHYFSTGLMVKEGIERGIQPAETYGTATPEQFAEMTRLADEGLAYAEKELPKEDPHAVHIILEEFAGVSETVDVGTSIVQRQGRSPDAIVGFIVSLPEIQESNYDMRSGLWNEKRNKQRLLRKHKSSFDMEPEATRMTMGTHRSIEWITGVVNQDMYTAWEAGEIHLPYQAPNKVPYEVRQGNNPEDLSGDELRNFFEHLTQFHNRGMQTNPIRPYLQRSYFEALARRWKTANSLVIIPNAVSETVHSYPQFLADHALEIGRYIDQAESFKREGTIYTAPPLHAQP